MGAYIEYLTNEILSNAAKCTLVTIHTCIFNCVPWLLLNNYMLYVNAIPTRLENLQFNIKTVYIKTV